MPISKTQLKYIIFWFLVCIFVWKFEDVMLFTVNYNAVEKQKPKPKENTYHGFVFKSLATSNSMYIEDEE